MQRLTALTLGLFGLLGLLVMAAPAQAVFGPPTSISGAGEPSSQPQIATDSQNNAIAVWTANDGSNLVVQSAYRPAGGSFGAPVTLSEAGQDASAPQVAVDGSGNAIAIWTRFDGDNLRVQAAFRARGGTFGAAQTLSEAGKDAFDPQVSLGGNAVAAWTRSDGANLRVQAAFRASDAWAFGKPRTLSEAGQDGFEPDVAVDTRGNGTVVWTRSDGANLRIQSSYKPRTYRFGAAVDVSPAGEDASQPEVDTDRRGGALAVWTGGDGSNLIVRSAYRPKRGAFGAAQAASEAGEDAYEPQVIFDEHGNALAAWTRFDGDNLRVQSAFRPKGGEFGAAQTLSEEGEDAYEPQVGVDKSAVVAWTRSDGDNLRVQGAFRPRGGTFGEARTLSDPEEDAFEPQVAVDESGNALAVWTNDDGSDQTIEFAFRPRLNSFSEATTLSAPGEGASQPDVATDLYNNAIAVWTRSDGADLRVQAAFRPAGGAFGPAETLSDPGENGFEPKVAFETDGDAVVIWNRSDGDNLRVEAAVRPAGGTFGPGVPISEEGTDAYEPEVAASDGAAAVWTGTDEENLLVRSALKEDSGGFGSVQTLSEVGRDSFEPDVAMSASGAPVAVWAANGPAASVQSAWGPSGGPFGAAQDIGAGIGSEPRVAVSRYGRATAVWTGYDGANLRARGADRPKRGSFGAPFDISPAGVDGAEVQIAFSDQEQNALAVWTRYSAPTSRIQASLRPPGGTFGAPEFVSPAGLSAYEPQVAMDDSAAVVWTADDGEGLLVQSAFRPRFGPFLPAETLSEAGQDAFEPQVAVDERGNALAVWTRFDGLVERVQAAFRPRG